MGKGEMVWLNMNIDISHGILRCAREIPAIFKTSDITVFSVPWTTK